MSVNWIDQYYRDITPNDFYIDLTSNERREITLTNYKNDITRMLSRIINKKNISEHRNYYIEEYKILLEYTKLPDIVINIIIDFLNIRKWAEPYHRQSYSYTLDYLNRCMAPGINNLYLKIENKKYYICLDTYTETGNMKRLVYFIGTLKDCRT
jgi:hypothetical protein